LSRAKGDIAENKAIKYLTQQGFKIVEQNFYAKKMGEIDIIATKDDVYHFIEVKSGDRFEPIYNITPAKLNKLLKSVQYYIKIKFINSAYCIDVITIHNDKIEFLQNVTI
jgi:putative endonuclease